MNLIDVYPIVKCNIEIQFDFDKRIISISMFDNFKLVFIHVCIIFNYTEHCNLVN